MNYKLVLGDFYELKVDTTNVKKSSVLYDNTYKLYLIKTNIDASLYTNVSRQSLTIKFSYLVIKLSSKTQLPSQFTQLLVP